MHDDPGVERYPETLRQDWQQIRISCRNTHLTNSDPQPGANCRDLRVRILTLESEGYSVRQWKARHHGPDVGALPVKAHKAVSGEVSHLLWHSVLLEVPTVGVKAKRYLPDAAADKLVLDWFCHSNGNICLPTEEVLDGV